MPVADHDGGLAQLRHGHDHLPRRAAGGAVELHEAAAIDGANGWQRFRHVTLPMLRPVMLFVAVTTSIGYLQFFEEPFVMTQGGPLDSTISMSLYTYKQFGFGNYGYAAALGYIIFVAVAVITASSSAPCERTREASMNTVDQEPLVALRSSCSRRRPGRWPHRSSGCCSAASSPTSELRQCPRPGGPRTRPSTTTGSCSPRRLPALLHELHDRRPRRHRGQPALLLDARLRPGQARLPGPERAVRASCSAR